MTTKLKRFSACTHPVDTGRMEEDACGSYVLYEDAVAFFSDGAIDHENQRTRAVEFEQELCDIAKMLGKDPEGWMTDDIMDEVHAAFEDRDALRTYAELATALLWRIHGWDMMDAAADGRYWRAEIEAVAKNPERPQGSMADEQGDPRIGDFGHETGPQRIRIETTVGGHLAVTLLPSGASALFRSTGEIGETIAHSLPTTFEAPINSRHQSCTKSDVQSTTESSTESRRAPSREGGAPGASHKRVSDDTSGTVGVAPDLSSLQEPTPRTDRVGRDCRANLGPESSFVNMESLARRLERELNRALRHQVNRQPPGPTYKQIMRLRALLNDAQRHVPPEDKEAINQALMETLNVYDMDDDSQSVACTKQEAP